MLSKPEDQAVLEYREGHQLGGSCRWDRKGEGVLNDEQQMQFDKPIKVRRPK